MSLLKGCSDAEVAEIVPENTFLLGYRGSIAHGMYVPSTEPNSVDDKDIMEVCFGPINTYIGLNKFEQREKFLREWDSVVYEARKFISLLCKANPNVMSLLWLDPVYYLKLEPEGKLLIENRPLFVTKEAYYSFTGYAYSQLKRMTHLAFEGYMGAKRKALVQKHGYDTKNAAHLIRLLRMGIEFLKDGELNVFRHDAAQLLEIKNGEWTLDRVKVEADILFKRAEAAFDASILPRRPDMKKVDDLTIQICGEFVRKSL